MFYTFGHPTPDFDERFTLLDIRPLILTNVLHFWTPDPRFYMFGHPTFGFDEPFTLFDTRPLILTNVSHFWTTPSISYKTCVGRTPTSMRRTPVLDECFTRVGICPLILTQNSHCWARAPDFGRCIA